MKLFWKIVRYALVFAIVGFAISKLIPHFKDFSQIIELKDKIHYGWVVAAILAQIIQYLGDGWLSQLLLQMLGFKMTMKDTIRIASLNVFAAHLLPIGEAGGIAAAYHFYRKLGVGTEKFIFMTLCWGVITNGLIFGLLFVSIFTLPEVPAIIHLKNFGLVTTVILVLTLIIYRYRKSIFSKIKEKFGQKAWAKHFISLIHNRSEYKEIISKQRHLTLPLAISGLMYYFSNIGSLAFSFMAFGTTPSIPLIIFAYSASLVLGRIALAPAGLGATDASLILIFTQAGIDPAITVAASLLYRIISFWLPIPAGCLSFYSLRKETSKPNEEVEFEHEVQELFHNQELTHKVKTKKPFANAAATASKIKKILKNHR